MTASNKPKLKPHVVACTAPFHGHFLPVLNIVYRLVDRGYDVSFVTGSEFKDCVEEAGASFYSIPSFDLEAFKKERTMCNGFEAKVAFSSYTMCIQPRKERKIALYAALEQVRERHPDREVVILTETFFLGDHALYLGAELPRGFTRRPRSVSIHTMPYMVSSQVTAPLGLGYIPDGTEEGRRYCASEWARFKRDVYQKTMVYQEKNFREMGAVHVPSNEPPQNVMGTSADVTLQMCPPSLEYDLPDYHPRMRFAGALAGIGLSRDFQYPSFWPDVTRRDRKVVAVTQGTVAVNHRDLLIPTLKALASRSDLVVVAILGKRGASLPADVTIPSNAHVIDYLPYQAILPYASVFVSNGGYGGFIQGMLFRVPMILAGTTEDKLEVACRGEYAGIAINLRTDTPEVDRITQAVDEVLRDDRYKRRITEIWQENGNMKTMDIIEGEILKYANEV
ncbi:hypothetical protein E4U42_006396 [Claviceps africana]|uniref:Erythromycin biosynthesis protein CIII-like C-terminal domain-containing protein n=1 Tax=Claviceps africana TaxID=83212 RepID=A0A8K0NGR2_9HYPO|nr:hypothetical protein E4U42_006396 [Claviceps africana]